MKIYYDLDGQKQRQHLACLDFTKKWMGSFDENGLWIGEPELAPPTETRQFERLSYCLPFMESGMQAAIREANWIIKGTKMIFCQFLPMLSLELLINYREQLTNKSIEKLEDYIKTILDQFLEDDLDFVGVNDNFPCIATYITLIGGERYERRDAYQVGVKRLNQLAAMYRRRGVLTEYNSPSYAVGQIHAMAELANHARDSQIREIALACEERLWVDMLGHLYSPVAMLAGPYSRAYSSGSNGPGNVRPALYYLLGDKLGICPDAGLEFDSKLAVRSFKSDTMTCQMHCPDYLVNWYLNRKYPYSFKATSEFNSSDDSLPTGPRRGHHEGKPEPATRDPYREEDAYEYPSGVANISTYMTERYSLGVASHEFHNGLQTDSFFVTYPRCSKPKHQKDIRTIYARYAVNDKKPGQDNEYPVQGVKNTAFLFQDEGRKLGLHHENTAMMLYKPKAYACKAVTSMKLLINIPVHNGDVEEIRLGNQKLENYTGASKNPCPVFVKDGDVFIAFNPLLLTNYGRENAVTVEKINNFVIISFINYEGQIRDFATRGFLLTGNGFVAEAGSAAEHGSFDQFIKKMLGAKIYDVMETNPHKRQTYTRITSYERTGIKLECEYSPVSEGVRYMSVNGWLPDQPKLFATDLDISLLPFMK